MVSFSWTTISAKQVLASAFPARSVPRGPRLSKPVRRGNGRAPGPRCQTRSRPAWSAAVRTGHQTGSATVLTGHRRRRAWSLGIPPHGRPLERRRPRRPAPHVRASACAPSARCRPAGRTRTGSVRLFPQPVFPAPALFPQLVDPARAAIPPACYPSSRALFPQLPGAIPPAPSWRATPDFGAPRCSRASRARPRATPRATTTPGGPSPFPDRNTESEPDQGREVGSMRRVPGRNRARPKRRTRDPPASPEIGSAPTRPLNWPCFRQIPPVLAAISPADRLISPAPPLFPQLTGLFPQLAVGSSRRARRSRRAARQPVGLLRMGRLLGMPQAEATGVEHGTKVPLPEVLLSHSEPAGQLVGRGPPVNRHEVANQVAQWSRGATTPKRPDAGENVLHRIGLGRRSSRRSSGQASGWRRGNVSRSRLNRWKGLGRFGIRRLRERRGRFKVHRRRKGVRGRCGGRLPSARPASRGISPRERPGELADRVQHSARIRRLPLDLPAPPREPGLRVGQRVIEPAARARRAPPPRPVPHPAPRLPRDPSRRRRAPRDLRSGRRRPRQASQQRTGVRSQPPPASPQPTPDLPHPEPGSLHCRMPEKTANPVKPGRRLLRPGPNHTPFFRSRGGARPRRRSHPADGTGAPVATRTLLHAAVIAAPDPLDESPATAQDPTP